MADHLSKKELDNFWSTFTPVAVELAIEARKLLLKLFPDAIETAEGKELGYGFDRGYKGLVFSISHKKAGINIGIAGGATLADPSGLVKGTGKIHRHVEILEVAKVDDAALADLLERALAIKRAAYYEVSEKLKG